MEDILSENGTRKTIANSVNNEGLFILVLKYIKLNKNFENKINGVEQGWGKCGLFEEFVRPSNCLLTSPYFFNLALLVCV